MTSIANSVQRWMQRMFKIEYCTILKVTKDGYPGIQCHSPDKPEYYNTVTLKVRNARLKAKPTELEHQFEIGIQDFVGNCFGHPWTPRVGDLVQVLFIYNAQPIILGPVYTTHQVPPFRAPTHDDAMYDDVWKWCQWLEPKQDKNHDYYDHPQGKMPICKKLFHGPVTGQTGGLGRDQQWVWDCKMGDAEPTCRLCEIIDSVPRSGEQWFKQYSTKTESEEAYNSRMEWHARCGSYLRFESECVNTANKTSCEYSEKKGHIRLGNAVSECDKRGHINFRGTGCNEGGSECKAGTIDMHSAHEAVAYENETVGARCSVVAPTDNTVTWAFEAIDFTAPKSFIRIYKKDIGGASGLIELNSEDGGSYIWLDGEDKTIYIDGTDYVFITADEEIHQETPLVHMTGNCKIDGNLEVSSITVGSCSHGACSCLGGGAGGTSGSCTATGSQQAIAHSMVTNTGTACCPSSISTTCSDGGSCTINGCDDTNIYLTATAGCTVDWSCTAADDGWGDWEPCF